MVTLILSFQLVSNKTEPFFWISCTSEVAIRRKMDSYLSILNSSNLNLDPITSSQSFKIFMQSHYVSSFCAAIREHCGIVCLWFHSLRVTGILLWVGASCSQFKILDLKTQWEMKGNAPDLTELHYNKAHNVGLCWWGPGVTRLSPGGCCHSGSAHGLASPDISKSLELHVPKQGEDPEWGSGFVTGLRLVGILRGLI